jgi:hypothetical protein
MCYNFDCIENLLTSYRQNPELIHFCRARRIRLTNSGLPDKFSSYESVTDEQIDKLNFPVGDGGVLYPPHSLHEDITNKNLFFNLCPSNDDIWFKAMATAKGTLSKKVKTHVLNGYDGIHLTTEAVQHHTLWQINEHKNDEQIKATFAKYNINKLLK